MSSIATPDLDLICVRELASRLRAQRLRTGWSLEELAERAGVSRSTLHHLEHGTTQHPRLLTLHRLAKAFGVEVEVLVPRGDSQEPADAGPECEPVRERPRAVSCVSRGLGHDASLPDRVSTNSGWEWPLWTETTRSEGDELSSTRGNSTGGQAIPAGLRSNRADRGLAGVEPGLFRDWTWADWALWETHLSSLGDMGLDRLRETAREVNRHRETRLQLQALLSSPLAGVATQLIQTLFETACRGTSPGHAPPV